MRSRLVPFLLAALILVGIALSVILLRRSATENEQPLGDPSPFSSPAEISASPGPTSTPAAPSGAVPSSNPTPDLSIDAGGLSKATIVLQTNKGTIRYKLYPNDAPATVRRMIELVQQGFYNGLTFHRVEPGFVVQGGDPSGTGSGGSGKTLKAEFNERRHIDGTVAMARARDPDSADSQFYITMGPQPHLDRSYTVFGQVVSGMDIVRSLQPGDRMTAAYVE